MGKCQYLPHRLVVRTEYYLKACKHGVTCKKYWTNTHYYKQIVIIVTTLFTSVEVRNELWALKGSKLERVPGWRNCVFGLSTSLDAFPPEVRIQEKAPSQLSLLWSTSAPSRTDGVSLVTSSDKCETLKRCGRVRMGQFQGPSLLWLHSLSAGFTLGGECAYRELFKVVRTTTNFCELNSLASSLKISIQKNTEKNNRNIQCNSLIFTPFRVVHLACWGLLCPFAVIPPHKKVTDSLKLIL